LLPEFEGITDEYKNLQDLNRSVHNPAKSQNQAYSVQSKYINNQNRKEIEKN